MIILDLGFINHTSNLENDDLKHTSYILIKTEIKCCFSLKEGSEAWKTHRRKYGEVANIYIENMY
jgi:hypothetical protein